MTARTNIPAGASRLSHDIIKYLESAIPAITDYIAFFSRDSDYAYKCTLSDFNGILTAPTIAAGTNILPASQSGQVYSNGSGAEVDFILPTAEDGLVFSFIVNDYHGTKITAAGSDHIRIAEIGRGAAAGYIISTTVGSYITLRAITAQFLVSGVLTSAVEWEATHILGTWDMDVT